MGLVKRNVFQRVGDKGFTLIEIVVVTGLLGILILVVVGVFVNGLKTTSFVDSDQRMDEEGKSVVERVRRGFMSMKSIKDYETVCDGSNMTEITMVDNEGEEITLECASERISLGGENVSSSDLEADCGEFVIRCDSTDKSPVIQLEFKLLVPAGTYDEGVRPSKSFSTEILMRGF